jgi:hypothetical protein
MDLAAGGLPPHEAAVLKALGQQTHAIAGRPEQLDDIAAPVPKHEHVPAERIIGKRRLDLDRHSVETGTHIREPACDPDACACRQPHLRAGSR